MRKVVLTVSIVVVLLVVAAGLVIGYSAVPSPSSSQSNASQASVTTASSSSSSIYPSRVNVVIVGSGGNGDDAYFSPGNIAVAVDATVTWTNQDRGVIHNVVSTSGTSFSSQDINSGTSWSFTFTKPGTYNYECSYHPWMTGTVTVVSPAPPG